MWFDRVKRLRSREGAQAMSSGPVVFERDALIALLKRDALKTGTFTLASGRTSHYYVDGRKVTLSAKAPRPSLGVCWRS